MNLYEEYRYGIWRKCLKAAPLRSSGGLMGGGTESIVSEEKFVDVRNSTESEINGTLQKMASNNLNSNNVVRTQYAVRRLMPIECERLQGLPDNWTYLPNEKTCSDSARYRAIGNGMCQNVADWLVKRVVEELTNAEMETEPRDEKTV